MQPTQEFKHCHTFCALSPFQLDTWGHIFCNNTGLAFQFHLGMSPCVGEPCMSYCSKELCHLGSWPLVRTNPWPGWELDTSQPLHPEKTEYRKGPYAPRGIHKFLAIFREKATSAIAGFHAGGECQQSY